MHLRALLAVVIVFAVLPGPRAFADVITLRADLGCPVNCDPASNRPGYMVEIAVEALALSGHTVDYQTMNWARSLHKAHNGEVDAVIGAIGPEVPGFHLSPPLGQFVNAVAVRRGEEGILQQADVYESHTVGAINGRAYAGVIAEHIRTHDVDRHHVQFLSGADPLGKNLKKLVAGRVDVVPNDLFVLRHKVREMGIRDRVSILPGTERMDLFIAFSPGGANSARYAADLRRGVAALRRSGRLTQIMARYRLDLTE